MSIQKLLSNLNVQCFFKRPVECPVYGVQYTWVEISAVVQITLLFGQLQVEIAAVVRITLLFGQSWVEIAVIVRITLLFGQSWVEIGTVVRIAH